MAAASVAGPVATAMHGIAHAHTPPRTRGPREGRRDGGRGGAHGAPGMASRGAVRGPPGSASKTGSIRVKPTSPVTKLAGAIAHTLRETGRCSVACIGAAATNQAIKGVMVARMYLEDDGKDLRVNAAINKDVGPNALELIVSVLAVRTAMPGDSHEAEFRVGRDTKHFKLAGAIAARFRERSVSTLVCQGMGANAVLQMAKAACLVEEYLADDGMRVSFVPARTTIMAGTGAAAEERTAMRTVFFATAK